jgi:hypothetical protein
MVESIVYLNLCVLTAFCGVHRRMDFFGTLILAIIVTPMVMLPILLLTGPSRRFEWHPRS